MISGNSIDSIKSLVSYRFIHSKAVIMNQFNSCNFYLHAFYRRYRCNLDAPTDVHHVSQYECLDKSVSFVVTRITADREAYIATADTFLCMNSLYMCMDDVSIVS
ncbi:hypothetical protein V1478_011205 [Vespula squamosa]|uniref:Uncharacterized protein n=1 Tax=Vespula squamosa TaxID=30214 RepID=A0ABD2ADU3_VESSQ